jgi:hypothetical protein
MAERKTSSGNCFVCGVELGKVKMKNHVIKEHTQAENGEPALLLKVEGAQDKNYWLLLDIAANAALEDLDWFLRKIWLECCGHISIFYQNKYEDELSMRKKIRNFGPGAWLCYEYDMGDTTKLLVSVIAETRRPKQKDPVRLLARNVAPVFTCGCGKPAAYICSECLYEIDNPFYCASCQEKHEHEEMMLPISNSPRMGQCAYDGEMDVWTFYPKKKACE